VAKKIIITTSKEFNILDFFDSPKEWESLSDEDIKDLIDSLSSDIQFIACVNNGSDDFADVSGTVEMSEFCYGDENE